MHAFPIVPAEDLSEVARFRIDLVRALVSATVGSPEAARLWKVPTNSDRILFCPLEPFDGEPLTELCSLHSLWVGDAGDRTSKPSRP